MPQQKQGTPTRPARDRVQKRARILPVATPPVDVDASSFRSTVPAKIRDMHGQPPSHEALREARVSPPVLPHTVYDRDRGPGRSRRSPPAVVEADPVVGLQPLGLTGRRR